ncbi:hypothetical protein PINS_up013768 [Pythium insidiosum]|nr:hypothetical protein PINS_up013768 [Pythium insidiosum]
MASHADDDGASPVDALWKEMKQHEDRHSDAVKRLLQRSMADQRTRSTKRDTATSHQQRSAAAKLTRDVAQLTSRNDAEPARHASLRPTEPQAIAEPFALTREINRLSDESSATRRRAALALERHFLLARDPADDAFEPTVFSDIAKPLFKRFNDPVEKVREVCVRVTTRFVARQEDLLIVLPYLMPAITRRIQSQWSYDEENQVFTRDQFLHDAFKRGRIAVDADQVTRLKPTEPSEEIRLLLLQLVDALAHERVRATRVVDPARIRL